MAQLSRLAHLYLKISDNLTEDDVRNLRSLLSLDEILGKAKVEKASPLEIFNMLADNATIGKGNLGFLVDILRCLGKGKLAEETELLEQEHKMEGRKTGDTAAIVLEFSEHGHSEQGDSGATTTSPKSLAKDSEPDNTDGKATISARNPIEGFTSSDEATGDTNVQQVTSEFASLHIKELVRLIVEPMKTPGLEPSELDSSTDDQDTKSRLKTLLAELDTPAVLGDQEKQFDLFCQIDYEIALEWYQKALEMSKDESAEKRDQILLHMNVGVLLSKVGQASSHLDTALQMAQQKGEEYGQMDAYMCMGDLQRDKFNSPRTSIQYYEQHLALARQLGDRRQEGLAYNRFGQAHFDMGEYKVALEWFQKSLNMMQEIGDKKEAVTAHIAVANAYRSLGNIDHAKSHFDTALQMAQLTGDQEGQMKVNCKLGDLQTEQLRSPRTAIQYYDQYLALARQLTKCVEEALSYERLGLAHYEMGEYEKALEWHKKYLNMSEDNGDHKQQIRAHTNLGKTYRLLGKQDQATSHISTALQMAQQIGDQHGQMEVYFSMGDLQREQLHSPSTSIQYYEEHLALGKQLGDRHQEGVAYNRLGRAHYEMGEYEAALEWDKKDLKISQEDGDKNKQIIPQKCIADSYKALGKPELAKSHFQSALTIAIDTGNKQQQMDIYLSLGDLHRQQLHEPQASLTYYTDMLALAKDLERKDKERLAYNRLGLACGDMKDHGAALEWHEKDLKMSQEDGDKAEQMTAHKNVAASYEALSKRRLARSHYQSAMAIAKDIGNKQEQKDIAAKLAERQSCKSS
ncbi:TTC28 [Branchiostoma lanceolatum]|uniref:TTC28 protein n=1 Tax=Branchiostoma lanceolatum TaxID=7740 RepID=A0A8K0EXP4_BRALA|nr:TTC28 [Branchiostoma lanceolatum]